MRVYTIIFGIPYVCNPFYPGYFTAGSPYYAMAVSFTEIFSSLCQTEKISAERRIVCEVAKIQPFERRLKRILFDELLGTKLFPRCVVKMARGLKMTPYEKALAFVYDLRSKRCYDRANQLEAALEFLTGDCASEFVVCMLAWLGHKFFCLSISVSFCLVFLFVCMSVAYVLPM